MDLLCGESYCIKRAFEDPVLLNDSNILETLFITEERDMKNLPSPAFFDSCDHDGVKLEVKPFMRKIVANWMLEVCEEQRCEEEVFPLSMNYLDRVLKVCPNLKKTQLQLLGATCMFIASKLKETIPLTGEKLVIYTDHSITLQDLMDYEMIVLHRLGWDCSAITAHDFLEQILCRIPCLSSDASETIKRHAQTFIALTATEFSFTMHPPSLIAASSISAAASGLLGHKLASDIQLLVQLQKIIRCDMSGLKLCQQKIEMQLTESLPHLTHDAPAQQTTTSHSNAKTACENGQPTTPTDVRDIVV